MRVKVNYEKDTVSFKGMSVEQFAVVKALLLQTRLGSGKYENAAFEMLLALEEVETEINDMCMPECEVVATNDDNGKRIEFPTLDIRLVD